MCGINGILWKDEKLVHRMNEKIKHRGPDNEGIYSDGNVTLGHRRLAILDLSKKGNQPMQYKNLVLVYNGEIYNYKQLRKQLKEYKFNSNCDTEVLLKGFHKYGLKFFKRLNGIYAFAIYDKKTKKIWLQRDPLGIKPLYYTYTRNGLMFSSEPKAFDNLKTDKWKEEEYLQTTSNDSESLFKNIFPVKPEGVKFFLDAKKHNKKRKEKELIDELDKLLNRAVKDQLTLSDVPVAAICSGGVDSALITAIASKYIKNLELFTVKVPGKTDESKYAKMVADRYNLKLHTYVMTKKDFFKDYKHLLYMNDAPFHFPNSVGIYKIIQLAKQKGFKVILSGEGADELFGGYIKHKLFYDRTKKDNNNMLWEMNKFDATRYCNTKKPLNFGKIGLILKINRLLEKFKLTEFERQNQINIIKDLEYYIKPILQRVDRMGMANSVEGRVPLLDNRIIEFAINLPLKYKINKGETKYLLKKVAERYLPKELIYRRKCGFPLPVEQWMGLVKGEEWMVKEDFLRQFRKVYKHKKL